jgi:hypothetical protein
VQTMLFEVLSRIPDFEIDEANSRRYEPIAPNDGWVSMPMRFTPGLRTQS